MGITASVSEKAIYTALKSVTDRAGTLVHGGTLVDLLRWGKRRNIFTSTDKAFAAEVWDHLGKDLWDSYCAGNKEAGRLAETWKTCKKALEQLATDQDVRQALQTFLIEGGNEAEDSGVEDNLKPSPCVEKEHPPIPHAAVKSCTSVMAADKKQYPEGPRMPKGVAHPPDEPKRLYPVLKDSNFWEMGAAIPTAPEIPNTPVSEEKRDTHSSPADLIKGADP